MNVKSFSRIAIVGAVMVTIAAIIAGLLWVAGNNKGTVPSASTPSASASASPSGECWTVKFEQTSSSGRFVATGLTGKTPQEDAAQLLEVASRDPLALKAYYEQIMNEQVELQSLYSGGCYTELGVMTYRALEAYFASSQFGWDKVTEGCNTFNYGDGNVTVKCGKITGNTKTLVVKGADGKKHQVLRRCGNGVTPTPPAPKKPVKVKRCDLKTMTIVVVSKKAAQSSRYTRDLSRCKTTPPPTKVQRCDLNTNTIVWVTEEQATDSRYTSDLSRCNSTPPPPPTTPPTSPPSNCWTGYPPSHYPNGLCPKNQKVIPTQPSPQASTSPSPIGTAPAPTLPAAPDPAPSNGQPVTDVNKPSVSAQPDSGSGATNTVAPSNVPVAPAPPAPAPSAHPTTSGIVGSD